MYIKLFADPVTRAITDDHGRRYSREQARKAYADGRVRYANEQARQLIAYQEQQQEARA